VSAGVPAHVSSPDARKEAKKAAAAAFARAVDACGYTLEEVAGLFGVCRSRARKMLSTAPEDRDVLPSAADILLADHALGERYLQELRAERLKIHGPPPAVTLEQQANVVLAADARMHYHMATALSNGSIEPHERPAIEGALRESEQARESLASMLRAGRR
jgi:transcriptional regulator with XRE-family HTH domain